MSGRPKVADAALYETDETAWLDRTADRLRLGRFDEIEPQILAEYLTDMARRDRKEVFSRLTVLLVHVLKWVFQPDKRSGGWKATILTQQQELVYELRSGTLRNHAETVLPETYTNAVARAAAETGLPATAFPQTCPHMLDELIAPDLIDKLS